MTAQQELDSVPEPPVLDVDPFSDEILLNPLPFFEAIRETAPVVYIKPWNYYAVGRYEEVTKVLTDFQRFTTSGGIGWSDIRKPGALRQRSPITEVDPPDHTTVRAALQRILSPLVIRKWREAFEKEAEVVAERLIDMREFDGVREAAEGFVLTAFPKVFGVDVPKENLILTGELNFNQLGPDTPRLRRSLERTASILDWYDRALLRESMLPGGFGEQIYQAEDSGDFAPGTARLHVRSFFRAGVDTTISGIGFTLNQLARNPDQAEIVRSDPSKVRGAFEEGIRFESPSMCQFRTTTGDTELSGYRLRGDTKVGSYLGAANRDPRKWKDPEKYDVTRQALGVHLAFGGGAHVCIGQMIARLEAECILGALFRRIKSIELTGEPTYRLVNILRTLETLPLRITPA